MDQWGAGGGVTKDEIKSLLECAQTHFLRYYELFLFYLLTGMRRSEPMTLQWKDIDFEAHMIMLDPDLVKTHRHIIMLPLTEEILRLRKQAGEVKPFDIYPDKASENYAKLRVMVNLEWSSIKTFRRSTTSFLRLLKIPGIIIAYIMGHSEEVALNNYFDMGVPELLDVMSPLQQLLPSYNPVDAKAEAALKSQLIKDGIRIAKDKNKSHLPN